MSYEDLPYLELRDKAFALARERHDVGFFYDIFRHAPAMQDSQAEGGSLGEISGTIIELFAAAEETFGEENVGELEPLYVARFATYLREHDES